jgi:hypothetical protein
LSNLVTLLWTKLYRFAYENFFPHLIEKDLVPDAVAKLLDRVFELCRWQVMKPRRRPLQKN